MSLQFLRPTPNGKIFHGWLVVAGGTLVVFGIFGSQFSFGVFLTPMTEEFGWTRATLSLPFGIAFMLSGLLRPVAGYLADRYSPRIVALIGVAIVGVMLLMTPLIKSITPLFIIFAVMSVGITLGSGPTLTKVVSAWFHEKRGLTLGLLNGGASMGAMVLVPATSLFVVIIDWRSAYIFLGAVLLGLIIPLGFILIRNRPQDVGLEPLGAPGGVSEPAASDSATDWPGRDASFKEAARTPLFWRLTFGYFV